MLSATLAGPTTSRMVTTCATHPRESSGRRPAWLLACTEAASRTARATHIVIGARTQVFVQRWTGGRWCASAVGGDAVGSGRKARCGSRSSDREQANTLKPAYRPLWLISPADPPPALPPPWLQSSRVPRRWRTGGRRSGAPLTGVTARRSTLRRLRRPPSTLSSASERWAAVHPHFLSLLSM